MRASFIGRFSACLLAATLLLAALEAYAQSAGEIADYTEAREAYRAEATAYWSAVVEKRRIRNAKRRDGTATQLSDYVLTQPPAYSGPPRPPGLAIPDPAEVPRPPIPVLADFLRHAAEQFRFVPDRVPEAVFKKEYARAARAAGLTRDQIVRVYVFETGGNGTHDVQSGLTSPMRPGARAISPAMGYNQLLSTNSVGLLAQHGDRFVALLKRKADDLSGTERAAMERKIEALRRMITLSRSVPNAWAQHDIMAKTTPGGIGIHAVVLDRDIGPLLQVQKLADSIAFARRRGATATLTAAELELMNLTGDGNGIDMVLMPQAMRERVPTSNFFQQTGYERNPIAARTATVAGLIADIETKMERGVQAQGARELAAAWP